VRYELFLSKDFQKQFERLDEPTRKRVVLELQKILENPRKQGVIQLTGQTHFRTRVGDYRILFDVNEENRSVLVVEVAHRSEIYKK
jgi:mRNA interferase RelE/StbE